MEHGGRGVLGDRKISSILKIINLKQSFDNGNADRDDYSACEDDSECFTIAEQIISIL